jgi:hypothetical protein
MVIDVWLQVKESKSKKKERKLTEGDFYEKNTGV